MMLSIAFIAALLAPSSHAAEADNFTSRGMNIIDVAEPVNKLANTYLQKAVTDVNAAGGACNETALYTELQKYFANHSKGQLAKDLLLEKKVPITIIPIKESIYRDWKVWDGYLLGRKKAATSALALSPLVRVGNQVVGIDKFEHMFGMGYMYFSNHYLNGKTVAAVLNNGILREKTFLGGNIFATGVFSYGDLAANFNGMRFWNHMLLKNDDILGKAENLGPYVRCEAKKWAVNAAQPIDFRNYMDASMDESINCSKFSTHYAEAKVRKSLERLAFTDAKGKAVCPVEPEKLDAMMKKYEGANMHQYMLNPTGIGTVSYFSELAK